MFPEQQFIDTLPHFTNRHIHYASDELHVLEDCQVSIHGKFLCHVANLTPYLLRLLRNFQAEHFNVTCCGFK